VFTPEYVKDYIPLLIKSNRLDYIQEIEIRNNDNILSNEIFEQFDILLPTVAFSFNELIVPNSCNYNINSSEFPIISNIRLLFDISNYSLNDFFDYELVLNISQNTGAFINISITQNSQSGVAYLYDSIFANNFSFSCDVDPSNKKIMDFSIYLKSSSFFSLNISSNINLVKKYDNECNFYLVENIENSFVIYEIDILFNETLNINGEACDRILISRDINSDFDAPVLEFHLTRDILFFTITGEQQSYISLSIFDKTKMLQTHFQECSIDISVSKSISWFQGLIIIYDNAGNMFFQEFIYNRNDFEIERDEIPPIIHQKTGYASFLPLILLFFLGGFTWVGIGNMIIKIIRKRKN